MSPSVSVIPTRTKFVFVVAKLAFKFDVWFVNVAVGTAFAIILTLKLSVVWVPNVFVNVIVDVSDCPLCLAEPLTSNPTDKLPFEFIAISELDDAHVPLWFEL